MILVLGGSGFILGTTESAKLSGCRFVTNTTDKTASRFHQSPHARTFTPPAHPPAELMQRSVQRQDKIYQEVATMLTDQSLTVHLTAPELRRLQRVAEIARRPVDEIVADTLRATLPPLLEDVPAAMRESLRRLEDYGNDQLRQELKVQVDVVSLPKYDALLTANATRPLSDQEQQELATLRLQSDEVMFRRAYAALLLKWRGQRVPTLAELDSL